ncbi:MAG: hypothetical protein C0609_08975 [Deltaproteobacteria bacterium]|nr:MAG: hypothetical protein C0609_08975 [Deltaproteobacteria bacterium]
MSGYIDVHLHWCLFGRNQAEVKNELLHLENVGYEALVVLPLPGLGASPERVLNLVPGAYRSLCKLTAEATANDDLESWRPFKAAWDGEHHKLKLKSFIDLRAWDGVKELSYWWGEGHDGIKGILVAEEDTETMAMPPMREAPGISREAYFDAQKNLFKLTREKDVPLIYHVDVTRHGDFIEEQLSTYTDLKINLPHLGFSRKYFAGILERHANVMSDISSLGPYIQKAPEAYREFIMAFPDRIMLGSDTIASSSLAEASAYLEIVKNLNLPEDVEAALLWGNASRFLGL